MFSDKFYSHLLIYIGCFLSLIWAVDEYDISNDLLNQYVVDPRKLPGLEKIEDVNSLPEMYAGHISMFNDIKQDPNNGNNIPPDFGYFFWKFQDKSIEQTNPTDSKPLIFWFNGGPGCSSMDGALVEIGPFRINQNGNAIINKGSWHTRGDLVFIDQPIGTGFSSFKSDSINQFFEKDLNKTSERLMEFLDKYFEIFPMDLNKDIILAGESYAGQYIPYFARSIQNYNKKINSENREGKQYNLKSLLIGNGWIDPVSQSLSYLPFAMENGLIDRQSQSFADLLRQHENCQNRINSLTDDSSSKFEYPECQKILQILLSITSDVDQNQCINVYNYDLKDSYPACGMNWPEDITNVGKFFSKKQVQDALHINRNWETNWNECRLEVDEKLTNQGMEQSISLLPDLLNDGIEIILFNGEKDLICNNKGVLDSIDNLEWGGSKGFTDDVQDYEWVYKNSETGLEETVGYIKYDKNLTFISVFNASHMVPYDKSEISRGIVDISMNHVLLSTAEEKDIIITSDSLFNELEEEGEDNENEKNNDGVEEEDNKKSDTKDDSDNEEDEYEDDDNDENYYEEDDDDEYEDDDDEEDEYEEDDDDEQTKFNGILVVTLFGLFGVFYVCLKYRKVISSKIFGSYYESITNQKKTVTWADDLENGAPLEENFGDDMDTQNNVSATNADSTLPVSFTSSDNVKPENIFELKDMI